MPHTAEQVSVQAIQKIDPLLIQNFVFKASSQSFAEYHELQQHETVTRVIVFRSKMSLIGSC